MNLTFSCADVANLKLPKHKHLAQTIILSFFPSFVQNVKTQCDMAWYRMAFIGVDRMIGKLLWVIGNSRRTVLYEPTLWKSMSLAIAPKPSYWERFYLKDALAFCF